jgi:hypothetical protein
LDSIEQSIKDAKLVERLQMDNARLRDLNRKYARNNGSTYEVVVDEFRRVLSDEAYNSVKFLPKFYPKHKAQAKSIFDKNHAEIAALVLSDLHGSETVRPEDSNGLNKYNSPVMSNRLFEIIDRFKRIVRGHESMYQIDEILLFFLGDMISGSIHPELVLTNDLLDVPASILVARLLIMAVYEIKTLGKKITIHCVVGNHARLMAKMPSKRQAHTSFDWLIYVMVQQAFANDEQVKMVVHTGQFGVLDVYGHRIIIEHGYGADARDGRDLETRIRGIFDSPTYRRATGLEGTAVDYVIIGDKHQAKEGERYMVNGCLSGSNEYGMSNRFSPIGAIQQMFGISKKRIPTWVYPLEVTDIMSEAVDNSFSEYADDFMKEHGR